jgi:WD40 repeat protein
MWMQNQQAPLRAALIVGVVLAYWTPVHAQGTKQPPAIHAIFSPDSSLLATTRSDARIIIWDSASIKEKLRFPVEESSFTMSFSPDGKALITAETVIPRGGVVSTHRAFKVWDVATGKKLAVLERQKGDLSQVILSGDHQSAAAGIADGSVVIWSNLQAQPHVVKPISIKQTQVKPFMGSTLMFAPSSKLLITGGWDGTVKVWDVQTGQERAMLVSGSDKGGLQQEPRLNLSADGKSLIIEHRAPYGEFVGQCSVWDLATFQETISAKTLGVEALYTIATPPDNSLQALFVKKGGAKFVVIRNPADRKERVLSEEHPVKGLSLSFSRDGKKLLVQDRIFGLKSGTPDLRLFDLTTDKIIMKLLFGKGQELDQHYFPQLGAGDSILIGQASVTGGKVRIWDIGKEKSRLDINVRRPSNLPLPVIAPDARTVFADDALWDTVTGKIRGRVEHELPKSP